MSDAAAPDDDAAADVPTGEPDAGLVEEAVDEAGPDSGTHGAGHTPNPTAPSTSEPPTGLPDEALVGDATSGPADASDPATSKTSDRTSGHATSEPAAPPADEAAGRTDDQATELPDEPADAPTDPAAREPDETTDQTAGDTAGGTSTGLPDDPAAGEPHARTDRAAESSAVDDVAGGGAGDAVLAGIEAARAEIAELRRDLAEARHDVESMLPDLAAAAREETVTVALAELAREETVAAGNARIQRSLDEMVRLTRRADDHVAELHTENQRLRAGELASATQPMIRDLVRLHDEVTRLTDASHPEARADLQLVGSRLLDTLARWGLTPFAPEPGDTLDATKHQGVGRVPSSDGEPGTIATVRRPGFAHDDGRTFRAAEVEVFAAPPPPERPAPTPHERPASPPSTEET